LRGLNSVILHSDRNDLRHPNTIGSYTLVEKYETFKTFKMRIFSSSAPQTRTLFEDRHLGICASNGPYAPNKVLYLKLISGLIA